MLIKNLCKLLIMNRLRGPPFGGGGGKSLLTKGLGAEAPVKSALIKATCEFLPVSQLYYSFAHITIVGLVTLDPLVVSLRKRQGFGGGRSGVVYLVVFHNIILSYGVGQRPSYPKKLEKSFFYFMVDKS